VSSKKVFVDSDVVVSSLLSKKGAADLLLNEHQQRFIISNVSKKELEKVVDRLRIDRGKLQNLIQERLKTIKIATDLARIKSDFQEYTRDINDTHILAGAAKAKARFLLTYNIKDFDRQKISKDLGFTVLTPAQYLQYLRSLD